MRLNVQQRQQRGARVAHAQRVRLRMRGLLLLLLLIAWSDVASGARF